MHRKKIDNLLGLDENERYEYFVRDVVQFELVWAIATNEGYIIFKDSDSDEIFPVWSHKELAEECMFDEHQKMGAYPIEIKLESFIDNCIPDTVKDNVYFGVFYDKLRKGLAIEGDKLKYDLIEERKEIWGE